MDSSVNRLPGHDTSTTRSPRSHCRITGFRFARQARIHANRDETALPSLSSGWGTYYVEDFETKKQESLHTREKAEAYRFVAARNQTDTSPAFSLQLARVY